MQAWLQILGCVSDSAANGEEAVNKVNENDYDVVLMDIMMPVMDGLDATRAIRSNGYHTLPIIALTASVREEDQEKTRTAGLNDFLAKPVDPDRLKEKLLEWAGAKLSRIAATEEEP